MANLRFCCDNIDKAQEVIAPKRRRLTNDGGCAPLKRRRGRGGEGYYVLPPTKRPALTGDVVLKATDGGTKIDASVVAAAPPPPQNVLLPPLSRRESIARTVWISHLLWTVVLPTAYPDEFRHLRRVAALVPKKTEEKVSERPAGPRTHFDLVRRWNPPVFLVTERPRPRQPITPFLVLGFHPVEERPLPPRVMTSAMTSLECLENWEWLAHEDAGREASRARGMATEAVIEREKTAYLAGPDPWTFDCVGRHLTGGGLADPESPSGWLRTVAHAAEAFFPLATLGAVTLVRTDGHRTAAFGSIEVGCPRLAAALFAGINLNDGHTDARFAPPSALGWRLIEESDADGGGRMVSVNAVLRSTWRCAFAGHFSSAEWLLSRVRIFAAPRTADMISAVRLCFELACRRGDMACAAWLERTFHFDEFSMQRTPGSALLDGEHAKVNFANFCEFCKISKITKS